MRKYFYISIGGALGAVLRIVIKDMSILDFNGKIPYDTLIINVVGCFTLALFLTVAFEVMEMDTNIRIGLSTGLLGAFTTFSTFCMETTILIWDGQYFQSLVYVALSLGLGLLGAYLGVVLARKVVTRLVGNVAEGS